MSTVAEISSSIVKTKEVIGSKVRNAKNEDLGKIEEIVLDKNSGNVRYAVLSFGGMLGMGDKLFALPWGTLKCDEENNCYILNVEKDSLKNAPGFSKDNWPNMADRVWGEKIHNFYGTQPYWKDRL